MIFYHAVKWLALLSIAQAGEKAFRGYGLAGKGENKASVDPRLLLAQEGVGWKKAAGGCYKPNVKISGVALEGKENKQVVNPTACQKLCLGESACFSLSYELKDGKILCSLYNSEARVEKAEKGQKIASWMRQCVSCHPQPWKQTRVLESTCGKCPSSLKTHLLKSKGTNKQYEDKFLCNNESCQLDAAKGECVAKEKKFDEWIFGECKPRLRTKEWKKVKARGGMTETDCSDKCRENINVTACKFRHGTCYWTHSKKPKFVHPSIGRGSCMILGLKESLSRPKREIPIPVQVVKARNPPTCIRPARETMLAYKIIREHLTMGGSFRVEVECSHRGKAVEKHATAQAIECESENTPYKVTGCKDMGFSPRKWWCRKEYLGSIKTRLTDMAKLEIFAKRRICDLGNKIIIGGDNSILEPGEKYLSGLIEIGNRKVDFQRACSVSEDRKSPDHVELSTLLDEWHDEEAEEFSTIGKISWSDEVNTKCNNLREDWLNFNKAVYGKVDFCRNYPGGCEALLANLKMNPYLKKEETNSEGNPVEKEETDSEETNTEGS